MMDTERSKEREVPRGSLEDDKRIWTLHRYFIWADRMRVHFDQVLKARRLNMSKKQSDIDLFLYMSYWYGGMYVLIEGWKDLELSDQEIDKLLDSPNVDLLRRYRNGTFHFQRDYFDKRFIGFMKKGKETVPWIRELSQQFSRFFLDWIRQKGISKKDTFEPLKPE